jgi:uncharacterized integral membrane protein
MQTVRRVIVLALFAALFVAAWRFASTNANEIRVDLLFFQIPAVPLWVALLSAFGIGVVLTGASVGYQVIKKNLVARRYRKTVRNLQSEIHQLRNLPLAGTDSAPALRPDVEEVEGQDGAIPSRSP